MKSKSQQIKQIISKIDISKISNYQQEYPQSKTLRQIIRYSKRIWDSNNDQEIFKLATDMAYNLELIVNKTGYVKNEDEKKHCLEISDELFKHTVEKKK